jgi:hypothetical protein
MMRGLENRLTRMEQVHGNSDGPLWVGRRLIQVGDSIRDDHGNQIDSDLRRRIETGDLRADERFPIRVIVSPTQRRARRSGRVCRGEMRRTTPGVNASACGA